MMAKEMVTKEVGGDTAEIDDTTESYTTSDGKTVKLENSDEQGSYAEEDGE